MAIDYQCPCGEVGEVGDEQAGGWVVCPVCKKRGRALVSDVKAPGGYWYYLGEKPEDADFFVPPPPEIGTLLSSHTSLKRTAIPRPLWLRILRAVVGSVGISFLLAVGLFFGLRLPVDAGAALFMCFSIVIAPFAVGLMLFYTRFRHYCGYVGDLGVAHYACSISRERVKVKDVLLFRDAKELRVNLLDILIDGRYQYTTYHFSWTDETGRKIFHLSDSHYSNTQQPPFHDKFHLALTADSVWSDYLLQKIMPRLDAGKSWTFALTGNDRIEFWKDRFELHLRGKVQTFHPQGLSEALVWYGQIKLKEPGGKEGWITSHGVHTFLYGQLANARVFFTLLERLNFVAPGQIAPR
jgi:hypothetical protein